MADLERLAASYRVRSANFSQRKIGHAHDNSADTENVAGAPQPNLHAHFIFRFENGPGNQSFFSIHDQNTAETSQPKAPPTDDRRVMDRACPRGFQRPLEKFDSARLCRKKRQTSIEFVKRRKLLFRGYKFKQPNTASLERDLQRSRLRRSTNDRRRRTWTPSAGRSAAACFFFICFLLQSSNNLRFAFFSLNVACQAFTWKISICSAKSNHVLRCSLSGELA